MEFIVIILVVLVLILGGWIGFLEYRYRQLAHAFRALMTGRSGADLETTLMDFVSRMDRVEQLTHGMDRWRFWTIAPTARSSARYIRGSMCVCTPNPWSAVNRLIRSRRKKKMRLRVR